MADVDGDSASFYERMPYPSPIIPALTPERIAAVGLVYGWASPPPLAASLLEIGCGEGLNVIGWAARAPAARCAGFDLSPVQIEIGRDIAKAAGLDNVDLHVGDILTYPREGEGYDYIVAHGVYAWVPPPVRRALLELMAARLNPGGIAYVSYDALPAAAAKQHLSAYIRDRVRDIADLDQRVETAKTLLSILAQSQAEDSHLSRTLDNFVNIRDGLSAPHMLHDWLEENYEPVSLADFAAAAREAGLVVVGDSDPADLLLDDLAPVAQSWIAAEGKDAAAQGTLLDLMSGHRGFRKTLLTRPDGRLPAARRGLRRLLYAYNGTREEVDFDGETGVRYSTDPQVAMTTADPSLTAVIDLLHAHSPDELTFEEICELTGLGPDDAEALILRSGLLRISDVHVTEPPYTLTPGERPRFGRLIRSMAEHLGWAINLRHRKIEFGSPATRRFITLCDGTRDRGELLRAISEDGTHLSRERLDANLDEMAQLYLFERED